MGTPKRNPDRPGRRKGPDRSGQRGKMLPKQEKSAQVVTCPTCKGSGKRGNSVCGLCNGTGKIKASY